MDREGYYITDPRPTDKEVLRSLFLMQSALKSHTQLSPRTTKSVCVLFMKQTHLTKSASEH